MTTDEAIAACRKYQEALLKACRDGVDTSDAMAARDAVVTACAPVLIEEIVRLRARVAKLQAIERRQRQHIAVLTEGLGE